MTRMRHRSALWPRRLAVTCALAWAAVPIATLAGAPAVTVQQDESANIKLRVRVPNMQEPDLAVYGSGQAEPYHIALAWDGDVIAPDQLPKLPPEGMGSIKALALRNINGRTRLEVEFDRPVQPWLRHVGDCWELRIVASALPASPPVSATQVARHVEHQAAPQSPARAAEPESLLLDMTVNGQRQRSIARAERWPDGRVLVAQDAWTDAHLAPIPERLVLGDGSPAYVLSAVRDVKYSIDRSKQSIDIEAPASAFLGSELQVGGPAAAAPMPPAEPGAMLNYDVSLSRNGAGAHTVSGAELELVAFNRWGNFVTSGLLTSDAGVLTATRLDSYWRDDLPERMETLQVGDTVGTGGAWSRPARFGGVRWGRNFALQPGFVTLPQMTLAGQAALPSTVDVLVNNVQRLSQRVQPGPFDLSNIPVVTGAGNVDLVVRDLLGRETVVHQSYYATPTLLKPGLSDYSVEAGWLRIGYGLNSHYGSPFAAGTLRRGWTSRLTGEARVELQARRQAIGGELASLLGSWGTGRIALAASSGDAQGSRERGGLLQASVERTTPTGGGSVQYERTSHGFAPFGESADPAAVLQRAREQWLAATSHKLTPALTAGAYFARQTRWSGERISTLGLSLSASLGYGVSLSMIVNRRLEDGKISAAMQVDVPLGNGIQTAGRVEREGGDAFATVSASRNPPPEGGVGWHLAGSTQESQRARGALLYNKAHAQLTVDAASDAVGNVSARAGARGTVGWVAGMPFATQPVGDNSVAVVTVDGVAGVPVKRSNQVVAHTDERGVAFVPGLVPWVSNKIEIDPSEMPLDVEVGEPVQTIVPRARSGAVVRFDAHRSRQALVILHRPDGSPVPVGTKVRLIPQNTEFLVGRRGEVWLTDLSAGTQNLDVRWPGGACDLRVPLAQDNELPRIGPLTCKGDRS